MKIDPKQRAKESLAVLLIWSFFVGVIVVGVSLYAGGIQYVIGDLFFFLILISPLIPLAMWLWDRDRAKRTTEDV